MDVDAYSVPSKPLQAATEAEGATSCKEAHPRDDSAGQVIQHLHLDFETKSTVDLKRRGVYVYAEDASTDLWCASLARGDGPVQRWFPGEPCPAMIVEHVLAGGNIVAHNAQFERVIWRKILGPRYGWPEPKLEQWTCTASMAAAMALPRALGEACYIMAAKHQKDQEGAGLMRKMTKPRAVVNPQDKDYSALRAELEQRPHHPGLTLLPDGTLVVWWYTPENVARLAEYCDQDVRAERALEKRLYPLSAFEREVWLSDQRINDRGVRADHSTIDNAKRVVASATERHTQEMLELTNGYAGPKQLKKILTWLELKGVVTENLTKHNVEFLLGDEELDATVRRVLEIRSETATASVAKLKAFSERSCSDERCRGNFMYSGAHTRRWTATGVQMQNLMRPTGKYDLERGLKALVGGVPAFVIDLVYGPPLAIVGECMRNMIVAAEGHDFIAADLANIEGRINAWGAGEQTKLQAFREFDAGTGPDLYLIAAADIYNRHHSDFTKKSPERQIGKVAELALGYQGAVGAFQSMAKNYGVNLPDKQVAQIVRAWRAKNPNIVQAWWDLQNAAFEAVNHPGTLVECFGGRCVFRVKGNWLLMRLPDGGTLFYRQPEIVEHTRLIQVTDDNGDKIFDAEGKPVMERKTSAAVSYWGVNSRTRKWDRLYGYGGLWCENFVQATARNLLAAAILRVEAAGYPVVLHAHDELVAEVPEGWGDLHEFERLLATAPDWIEGCPIAAEGWRGKRYRK
jgi:DNA polymerase